MTTASVTPVIVYPLTGTAVGPFATSWPYELPTEVQVWLEDTTGETLLVLGSDYTLIGATPLISGGSVTLDADQVPDGDWDGQRLIIRRTTERLQARPYGETTRYTPAATEAGFDKLTRVDQDQAERLGRVLSVPQGEAGVMLPKAAARRDKLAGFEDTAEARLIASERTLSEFDTAVQSSLDAAAAAVAAQEFVESAIAGVIEPEIVEGQEFKAPAGDAVFGALKSIAPLWAFIDAGATASQNLAALNALIAFVGPRAQAIDLAGRTITVSGALTNPYGVQFDNGKIIGPSAIAGQVTQLNTAAYRGGIVAYREHMDAFWLSVTAKTLQRVLLFGDSTVEMGPAYPLKAEGLVKLALRDCGINYVLDVENNGVSGTAWSDLDVLPHLASDVKSIYIKYGINDADKANPLATMAADARAKLSAIRAATYGDYYSLSIVLSGPNATQRPSHNQDPKWYEDVRAVYLELCREFGCTYIDLYAYEQDATRAPGFTMDSFDGGQGLHPTPVKVYDFWRQVFVSEIFAGGYRNIQVSNNFHNLTRSTEVANPAAVPAAYHYGVTFYAALQVDLWPASGSLMVFRDAEDQVVQVLTTLDQQPRTFKRSGGVTAGVWTQWDNLPIQAVPGDFRNSWDNAAGSYMGLSWWIDNGDICVQGMISGGTTGADIQVAQLPATHYPLAPMRFGATAAAGSAVAALGADGALRVTCSDNTLIGINIRVRALGVSVP